MTSENPSPPRLLVTIATYNEIENLPLLVPALVSVWLWSALLTYRELTVATFLSTPNNVTLPVVVWGFWYAGYLGNAAAITVVLVAVLLPLIGVYWLFSRRTFGSV